MSVGYVAPQPRNSCGDFDIAENFVVVLLFHEADAMFAKRREVKDGHDGTQNVEITQSGDGFERKRNKDFCPVSLTGGTLVVK